VKATITERGQISIPAQIRREMRLEPGQVVVFERISATECRLIVEPRPVIKPDPLAAIGFAQRHGLPAMTTEQWMDLLREGEED
jgi:AbrB family looped-hinge helix DNA binding protein